jgi:hypothetical protein
MLHDHDKRSLAHGNMTSAGRLRIPTRLTDPTTHGLRPVGKHHVAIGQQGRVAVHLAGGQAHSSASKTMTVGMSGVMSCRQH